MISYFRNLLDADTLAPHGICLLWRPELIWTHVIADGLIGLAYYSIPIVLAWFVWKRRDLAFGWIFWSFAAFILACGTTHFFAIWTLWNPDYGPEALVKLATAGISVATAVALWPLLPKALALPSPEALRIANTALTERVAERDLALAALQQATEERRRAEDELRQAQKMDAVGQLTGGVAHDFNNLLTVVIANLERARRLAPDDSRQIGQALDNAMAGAERAAVLTDRLLAFARKQPLHPAEQDLNRLIGNLLALFDRSLGPQIELAAELQDGLWPTRVDANQTENALLNLVVNARDAMPDGGRQSIRTRNIPAGSARPALGGGDYVMIEVSDTGGGMSLDVQEHAFEPFFTTKPPGQGTGLGLSQVYGFAKQSDGHATIHSQAGTGTTVRLFLPRVVSA